MVEQIMGLVRGLFTAIAIRNHALVDSILAEANTAGVLQQLLEAVDHRGMCPLHAAADRCDSQMVTALLHAGAPVESAAADGSTALVLAACAGDVGSVMALLNAGAAVAATDFNAVQKLETAEHQYGAVIAAIAGAGSAQVMQQLLAAVQLPPSIADRAAWMAIVVGYQHLLQQLFDAGADRGAALCHAALASNHLPCSAAALELMQELLAAGVPVDSANQCGTSALMFAAAAGSVQGVQVLLAAGAAADARDQGGRTALDWTAIGVAQSAASEESRVALVRLLIQAGVPASLADFIQEQQQGRKTPLDLAACYGFPAVVRELYQHISANGTAAAAELQAVLGSALHTAIADLKAKCHQGHAHVGQVLLQLGADPLWIPAGVSTSVLQLAAVISSPAVVDTFVQYGNKQQLSTAVMLDAAVNADCFHNPSHDSPPRSVQLEKALILVQAAVERSDPASVYAALQPGAAASSPVGEYGGTSHLWPRLRKYFAQVMCSMCRGLEDQFKQATEQRVVVQHMCISIARGIGVLQPTSLQPSRQ